MKVGIVGLGLIGGSMAKAYKSAGHTVLGLDIDKKITEFAVMDGTLDSPLTDGNLAECELLFIAVYPKAAVEYLRETADRISADTVVIDLCGTKRGVCEEAFEIAAEHGFTFVGGHPMAGTHNSGYKYAKGTLFKGAPMIIVPPVLDDMALLDRVKTLLSPAGFGFVTATTADEHDKMIAFTSQLAHIVSNAYIKSPRAGSHKGFSAGSYKDLTRVAWLNPNMWAELFLENRDHITDELDTIIDNLTKYRTAIKNNDRAELIQLLDEGRRRKEEVDGH